MKRINKEGPARSGRLPASAAGSTCERWTAALHDGALVVDTRPAAGVCDGTRARHDQHSAERRASRRGPAGSCRYTTDFYLIVDDRVPQAIDTAVRDLAMIGLDRVAGYFDAAVDRCVGGGRPAARHDSADRRRRSARVAARTARVTLVDVRNDNEWADGHIAGARHIPLGYLRRAARRDPAHEADRRAVRSRRAVGDRRQPPAGARRRSGHQSDRRDWRVAAPRTSKFELRSPKFRSEQWPRRTARLRKPPPRCSASARSRAICSCARGRIARRPRRGWRRGTTSSGG